MKYYYIGTYPPPYGGASIKNAVMFRTFLKCGFEVRRAPKKGSKFLHNLHDIIALLSIKYDGYFLGVSNPAYTRWIIKYLIRFGKKRISQSILIVMGGEYGNQGHILSHDRKYQEGLRMCKKVIVELNETKNNLENLNIHNVLVMPNLRERPKIEYHCAEVNKVLRCVFASKICEEKGVSLIMEILKDYPDIFVDFYGGISEEYKMKFYNYLKETKNATYKGVICNEGNNEIFSVLNQYDFLLLFSSWKAEGIPGIIVESKIAAISTIISKKCNRGNVVINGIDGIVLEENTLDELHKVFDYLQFNNNKIFDMKKNAKISAETFIVDNYIEKIKEII